MAASHFNILACNLGNFSGSTVRFLQPMVCIALITTLSMSPSPLVHPLVLVVGGGRGMSPLSPTMVAAKFVHLFVVACCTGSILCNSQVAMGFWHLQCHLLARVCFLQWWQCKLLQYGCRSCRICFARMSTSLPHFGHVTHLSAHFMVGDLADAELEMPMTLFTTFPS